MKRTFKKSHIMAWCLSLLCVATITSCSKWDDFTKYIEKGEISYTGKLDSVKLYSGKKRVRVTALLKADPKIVKCKVFWNGFKDSVSYDIIPGTSVTTFDKIIDASEGVKTFTLFTYDAAGNSSVPVVVSGTIYGDAYQRGIANRIIENAEVQSNGSALIQWTEVSPSSGIVRMRIKYTDKFDKLHDTVVASAPSGLNGGLFTTTLPDFKSGSAISYRTAYLPNRTAIDTFFVDYQSQNVKADVTRLYLSNTGPFSRATFDGGRWGTLADPWITSANVKNHSGFGGYANDEGGSLVMESGWSGTANITNGKIYQTTSLPPGNYIFEISTYSEAVDQVYVVAAAGDGLPDISNISTALGSNKFTVNLRKQEAVKVPFVVTQTQNVSLGFLSSMVSGNQYWRVTSVKLFKN